MPDITPKPIPAEFNGMNEFHQKQIQPLADSLPEVPMKLDAFTFVYKIWKLTFERSSNQFVVSGLYWVGVRAVLHRKGYAKRTMGNQFIFINQQENIIREVSPEIMRDELINYVESISEPVVFAYNNVEYTIPTAFLLEIFLNNSNNLFNDKWLKYLKIDDRPSLKDSRDNMYFAFQNCLITVSKDLGIKKSKLKDLDGVYVWEDQIIKHDFDDMHAQTKSHFGDFLMNICEGNTTKLESLSTGIGYLMHHHTNPSEGQAVILYDENIGDDENPMGGSGKGLFVKAIKEVRKVSKVDGKALDPRNKFKWEMITPSTQVAWLDDVNPNFDFSMLHSNLAEGWTIERKYLSQFVIEAKDSPKTVISSNSIIKGGGTTNLRRQFIIEVGDFYSRQIFTGHEQPILDTHKCLFFSKDHWDVGEWNAFFKVMLSCAEVYLEKGLISFKESNIEKKKLLKHVRDEFLEWAESENFTTEYEYDTRDKFNNFMLLNPRLLLIFSQRQFSTSLLHYAQYRGWKYTTRQSGGRSFFAFVPRKAL